MAITPFSQILADPDGDGLTNDQEVAAGTNPRNPDSDGDGYPDGWEADHSFDPTDPGSKPSADSDHDGISDEQ